MRKFEEGLAFYIQNQLAGQPIQTCQELYQRAIEVERVKTELGALNSINLKRKGFERRTPSESVNQKKSSPTPPKSHLAGLAEPYGKCGRTNHTTLECRARTNKCMWCGSPEHLIVVCLRRLKAVDKGVVKPLAPPRQGVLSPRSVAVGQALSLIHI